MIFFFKKNEVHLDCFTSSGPTHRTFPIAYATKYYPDWWKDLDNFIVEHTPESFQEEYPTMKTCWGMVDYYKSGLMIPLWSEAFFEIGEIGNPNVRGRLIDGKTAITLHNPAQRGSYAVQELYQHIKIESPWLFSCKEEIKWLWNYPVWNFEDMSELTILPGILEFKYQKTTNINIMVKRKEQRHVIHLKPGQPLAHLVPLTEKKLVIHNHLVSEEEYKKMENPMIKTRGNYKFLKKIYKSQEQEKKCPFSFRK